MVSKSRRTRERAPLPAKLVMPKPKAALARRRLFQRLQGRDVATIVWLHAPAGGGKTFLLATCLQAPRTLWYEIDASDRDVSSLFHYLRVAAEAQLKKSLDLPSFQAGPGGSVVAFARRYFTRLFEQLPRGTQLAFDNYHEAQNVAEWNAVFRELLAARHKDSKIFVASRRGPPPQLARLRAAGELDVLTFDELRFDEGEVEQWMRKLGRATMDSDALVRSTHGWAVAISLLARMHERSPQLKAAARMGVVFEYLAVELFEQLEPSDRALLPMLALLPRFSAEAAMRLTARDDAPAMLRRLERDHLLIEHHGDGRYGFHDLVRAFLLERFREQHGPERRNELSVRAARLLEDPADFELAAELLCTGGAVDELCSLIERAAPELAAQGRLATLAQAISLVPEGVRAQRPWLEFWSAVTQLGRSQRARSLAEQAFAAFRACGDSAGAALAWAVVVQALILEGDDFYALVHWLKMRDALAELPPVPTITTRVALGEVVGWAYAGADFGPDVQARAERALAQVQHFGGIDERLLATVTTAMVFTFAGRHVRGRELLRAGQLLVEKSRDPLSRLIALHAELLISCLFGGRFRAAEALVDEALSIGRAEKIPAFDLAVLLPGVMCALALADVETADRLIAAVRAQPLTTRMARGQCRYILAWHALSHADLSECERLLSLTHDELEQLGFKFAMCEVETARVVLAAARSDAHAIQAALAGLRSACPSPVQAATRALAVAYSKLCLGEVPIDELGTALRSAREVGWYGGGFIDASIVRRLCSAAFAHAIEVEYASTLLRAYELEPGDDGLLLPSWPWPVRTYLLGGLQISVADKPVVFGRKLPTVPIALLRLLAAANAPVPVPKLLRALWPAQDARRARAALDTAVYRLRKLLGSELAVEHAPHGTLALAPAHCWSDVRVLHLVCDRIAALAREHAPPTAAQRQRLDAWLNEVDQGALADERDPLALRQVAAKLETKTREARDQLTAWAVCDLKEAGRGA